MNPDEFDYEIDEPSKKSEDDELLEIDYANRYQEWEF